MTKIKTFYSSVVDQYCNSIRRIVNQTGNMIRTATTKLLPWNSQLKTRPYVLSSTQQNITNSKPTIPEFADVVIIGGGISGCSALYHLAKRGTNAILLERSKLTSGTTWHTAGMFWRLRPSDIDIQLLDTTQNTLIRLEKETGENPGWLKNGGIFIAHNEMRMSEYRRLSTMGKYFGIESHLISPIEAKKLFPLLDENSFIGALYSPQDGSMDPTMFISSLTKYAKQHGSRVIENCPVNKILTKENEFGKHVTGVETPYGIIRTTCILNAAGVWSNNIAKMAGLHIPIIPMKHAYVVTEPINGVQNLPNIRDHDFSIYIKSQGSSLAIGGYESNPIILKSVPRDFDFSLYELDWTVFNVHVNSMVELIPKLRTTGIKITVCGPESFTPDHKPIMGEDPRCTGFFYSCGYNSSGMMLSGGCGDQIAAWIINGRPEKHMFAYDIRRFTPTQMRDSVWANERSHEAYAKNYSIIYPNDAPLSGRNFKEDTLHNLLIKHGAVMEEAQGWERPAWYQPGKITLISPYDYYGRYGSMKNKKNDYATVLEKEYTFDFPEHHNMIGTEALTCRNKAALFNLSCFGKFYLCGAQSQEAANYLFTANVDRELNRTVYTCMLNKQGGVEADCTVTSIEAGSGGVVDPIFQRKGFYIVAGGLSSYQTLSHINRVLRKKEFEATIHDATESMGILSVQGPNSRYILEEVCDKDLSDKHFPFSTSRILNIKGCLVRVFRISYVGELGYELHIPNQACEKIFNALMETGKVYGLKLAGFRAMYSLSCEKGYHLWNKDVRIDDNPVEAGMGFVCRRHGDYLGKKAVDEMRANGIKRKLVHIHVHDRVPLYGLEAVYRNNELVGYLRRGDYSYTWKNSIGQAYISHPKNDFITTAFLESGEYEVEAMGKKYPGKIYLKSPFDPENKRLQGIYS